VQNRLNRQTNKPYRHQQHLPKISQNVSGAVRMVMKVIVSHLYKHIYMQL